MMDVIIYLIQIPPADVPEVFDDEHGQNPLVSLHPDAEKAPIGCGTSRASSVRFDYLRIELGLKTTLFLRIHSSTPKQ